MVKDRSAMMDAKYREDVEEDGAISLLKTVKKKGGVIVSRNGLKLHLTPLEPMPVRVL